MPARTIVIAALGLVLACAAAMPAAAADTPAPRAGLRAFADEAELDRLLRHWQAKAEEEQRSRRRLSALPMPAAPAPAAAPMPAPAAAAESITNVQTAGVDEGGIVKRHGDHLIVLRRGRLFTVRIGADRLEPVAHVDAFPPGAQAHGDWYDELLVAGDTVVVVGYSYRRGGTEIGLFDIDAGGHLAWRASYHLRSSDYYSAGNYATRLVGDTLVLYTPQHFGPWGRPMKERLPALRRWQAKDAGEFRRILPATRIFRTDDPLDPFGDGVALHTVTTCDLARPELECTATAVLGPPGRVFYVSQDSVFVWTTARARGTGPGRSAVFRIPLDGATPTALKTTGGPVDQLSFLQGEDGHLNVLLRADSAGEGMWAGRLQRGELALLRVPLDLFGDGTTAAPSSAYRSLPAPPGGPLSNRFIGDWLVYGQAARHPGWGRGSGDGGRAYALRHADAAAAVREIPLRHGVERIEAMGRDAVLVGNAGDDLLFSSLRLDRDASLAGVYVHPGARQAETRTHGFFYRPTGTDQGMVGLPVLRGRGAAVAFLRNAALRLQGLGQLEARPAGDQDDGCQASCVDWYGNARPIFVGERVFALMGYELVEGHVRDGRIDERRRIDFTPPTRAR